MLNDCKAAKMLYFTYFVICFVHWNTLLEICHRISSLTEATGHLTKFMKHRKQYKTYKISPKNVYILTIYLLSCFGCRTTSMLTWKPLWTNCLIWSCLVAVVARWCQCPRKQETTSKFECCVLSSLETSFNLSQHFSKMLADIQRFDSLKNGWAYQQHAACLPAWD